MPLSPARRFRGTKRSPASSRRRLAISCFLFLATKLWAMEKKRKNLGMSWNFAWNPELSGKKSEVEFEYHQVGARWGPKQPVLNGGRKPRYRIITADNPSIKASIGVFHPIYSWLLGAPLNGTKNWATKTPYAWHESCFQTNDLFFAWSMTKMIWVCLHDR